MSGSRVCSSSFSGLGLSGVVGLHAVRTRIETHDVAVMVYLFCKVIWRVPDFTGDSCVTPVTKACGFALERWMCRASCVSRGVGLPQPTPTRYSEYFRYPMPHAKGWPGHAPMTR